jgi:hypothetical protein
MWPPAAFGNPLITALAAYRKIRRISKVFLRSNFYSIFKYSISGNTILKP